MCIDIPCNKIIGAKRWILWAILSGKIYEVIDSSKIRIVEFIIHGIVWLCQYGYMTLSKSNLLWALVFPSEKLKDWAIWFPISLLDYQWSLSLLLFFSAFYPTCICKVERYLLVRKLNNNGSQLKFFTQPRETLVVHGSIQFWAR